MRKTMNTLHARRAGVDTSDKGFTLVELLVVIIIIGILSAVAIPTFMKQRVKAYDSAVTSTLGTFKSEMETQYTELFSYPEDASSFPDLVLTEGVGIAVSVDNSVGAETWVVVGSHERSENSFWASNKNGGAPQKVEKAKVSLSAAWTNIGATAVPTGVEEFALVGKSVKKGVAKVQAADVFNTSDQGLVSTTTP